MMRVGPFRRCQGGRRGGFAHGEDRVTSSATASRVADAVAVDGAGATFHAFQPVVISIFAERCNPSSYYWVR